MMAAWPHVAGAAIACLATIAWFVREPRLRRRPALVIALGVCVASLVFVALVALHIAGESYFRFSRHWPLWLGFAAMAFITKRLAEHSRRQHRFREVCGDALIGLSVLCATGAASEVEIGRPLDKLAIVLAIDDSRSIELVPHVKRRLRTERMVVEAAMKKDDRIATVVFGSTAVIQDPLRPKRQTTSRGALSQ